jgi:hypothetical protein
MNKFTSEFNVELANTIDPFTTKILLKLFKNIRIFDEKRFIECYGYVPSIYTCFVVENTGSWISKNVVDDIIYTIDTYNGTLASVSGLDIVGFGNEYKHKTFYL